MRNAAKVVAHQEWIEMGDEEAAASQSNKTSAKRTKQMTSLQNHTWQEMISTINKLSKTQ